MLSIADAYLEGDFMSVPNGTTAAGYPEPRPDLHVPGPGAGSGPQRQRRRRPGLGRAGQPPPSSPTSEPTEEPGEEPTKPPKRRRPVAPAAPPVTVPALPQTSIAPVDNMLTLAQAIVQCTLDGYVNNLLGTTTRSTSA